MFENDTSASAIGKRLRYVRKLADLSREDLAKEAGVSQTSISYWEHASDESSKMTLRSMGKVLKALKEKGVECTERWLRSGNGSSPRVITNSTSTPDYLINHNNQIDKTSLSIQLITNMSDEIKRFSAISHMSVITKVDSNCMYPALKQGDIVGGVWQSSSLLKAEEIGIIEIDEKLQVRRIIPIGKNNIFNIFFLTYDINQTEPFEMKEITLEKVAPIIRVWR